jgi:hypothetical protein
MENPTQSLPINKKDCSSDPNNLDPCPHCGGTSGTWFDRCSILDEQGNPLKYEEFPTRCEDCGKNVNAPKDYYKP